MPDGFKSNIGKNDIVAFPGYLPQETSDINPDQFGQKCLLKK